MSRHIWPLLLSLLLLNGCSMFGTEEDETRKWSQQKLYTEASEALDSNDYERAIKYYGLLESRYPFGKYAHQAQLNIAYAYYRYSEPASALNAVDRFVKLHPKHPATAYAYYLRGLINFNHNQGFFDRFVPTDVSQRDPGAALDSYKDFGKVIQLFPDSEYAEDASKRMLYLRNNLARLEVHVARYYMKRGAFVAAANRAEYVVQNYRRTPALREALEIMIAAYERLELTELAEDTRRVLALNDGTDALIVDPRDLKEKTLGHKIWDYLELDKN